MSPPSESHSAPDLNSLERRITQAEARLETLEDRFVDLARSAERVRELESLVNRDPLTGLPIRRQFNRRVQRILEESARRERGPLLAVGLLRLDSNYSRIRNTRDRDRVLLYKTGERIRRVVGDDVFQSERFDEFLIILRDMPNQDGAELRAQEILEAIGRPHAPPANDIAFSGYLALALYPVHGETLEDLIGNAEIALRDTVHSERRISFYNDESGARFRERERLETELRQISRTGFSDFSLVFQPFVDSSRTVRGGETLIRWTHPELGPISPGRFIPIAEEGGAIRFLGQWTLYQTCRLMSALPEASRQGGYISVNLSPLQFKQLDLIDRIGGILESTRLPAECLNLEVTETIVMDDPEEAIAKMRDIKSLGVHLALDDFGTGYSSLSYLRRFAFDTLKIDRSFVAEVDKSPSAQKLLATMIAMARAFGMRSLAEGVEREEELEFLWSEGCDLIQGYYFSPPVPWDEFAALLDRGLQ